MTAAEMTSDRRRDRIRWHCRRGMLELDLILSSAVERYYDAFSESERDQLEQLLALEDTTLFACLQGIEDPPHPELRQLVAKLRQ